MHEFVHILQNSKNFFIVSSFSDLRKLEKELYQLISKNLTGSYSQFLTGKHQDLHSKKIDEILTYQMNNSINWRVVKQGTKEQYFNLMKKSNLFNLSSPFWKKRFQT
jgi:hypothetical protein